MSNLLQSQRTKFTERKNEEKEWILIDAREQILGRLAGRIVHRLRGKHRPDYAPHLNNGDYVVVVNAGHIKVTGNKMKQKLYRSHTHYPGGLNTTTLEKKMETDPIFALKKAVKRMLPGGSMGRLLLKQVHFYAESEHPHAAQRPVVWEPVYR